MSDENIALLAVTEACCAALGKEVQPAFLADEIEELRKRLSDAMLCEIELREELAAQLEREAIARKDSGIYAAFDKAYADYKREEHMTLAWYDPTNKHVSTDKHDPLFTPLGQLWPLDVKREWVGLTDEEITEIRLKTFDAVATNYEVYRAIEAKLKEKNNGND
jgi:hypothetical protein